MLQIPGMQPRKESVKETPVQTAGSDKKPGCYNHVHRDINLIRLFCVPCSSILF